MKKIIYLFLFITASNTAFSQHNTNISGGHLFDAEPYLAINPNNHRQLVVAWMGWKSGQRIVIKTKRSNDGGLSWGEETSLPHTVVSYQSADPSLAFDDAGNVFVSYVDFTGLDVATPAGGIYVGKLMKGENEWQTPVKVMDLDADPGKQGIDRPWISIDPSQGPYKGQIYITSMTAKKASAPYHPYLNVSKDGGNSFGHWRYLDGTGWLAGEIIPQPMPTPCVAADGSFHAVYPSYVRSQNPLAQYILASSTDGGNHFTYQSVFQSKRSVKEPLAKRAYLLRADPSDARHLAFFYLDVPFGDIDVFITETKDGGATWSTPVRVNDDPTGNNRMQDMIWADFDDDGDIVVAWRDRRHGQDGSYKTDYEIFGAYKHRDSLRFSRNFRISDARLAYHKILAQSGNDFLCIKIADDTIHTVWADTRDGKLNVWYQRLDAKGVLLHTGQIASESIPQLRIYPNPSNTGKLFIEGDHIQQITIFDNRARTVLQKTFPPTGGQRLLIDISHLNHANYFIQSKTKDGHLWTQLIKL